MTKYKWLPCDEDWSDVINIIKLEKNCNERLREFHNLLERDGLTLDSVIDNWCVIEKSYIEEFAETSLEEEYVETLADNETSFTYWFFNIYTGEALHVKYSVKVSCSGIIED